MRGRPCRIKLTRRFSVIAARSRLSTASTGISQGPKQFDERRKLVVRIQAARIRQHPDCRTLEALRLRPNGGVFQGESVAVGAHAEKGESLRAVAADLVRQTLEARDKLLGVELVGSRGRAVDEVGDAITAFQQIP